MIGGVGSTEFGRPGLLARWLWSFRIASMFTPGWTVDKVATARAESGRSNTKGATMRM